MENILDIIEAAKKLNKNQKSIIRWLSQDELPVSTQFFNSDKDEILKLQDNGFITVQDGQVSLTSIGVDVLDHWKNQKTNNINYSNLVFNTEESKQQKIKRINQLLALYKQGLSYQGIGDRYGLSTEHVKRILNPNVKFRVYLREREEAKLVAEEQKKEQAKQEL